ncbi:NERD domain-containing protein [Bacillus sp. DNRA2]|uniref:nuclease-related domain-containing protein n=1 Tax=Bacillus sp. DNRA2 TaxID=2723053 RepID=UPI00145D21E5|nr:nuclease-related domain-containing protein [Bacillus sp. DNRA2]NMD68723.1 NERD domain-containing protein [Bacillus sp. DNRA2]
MKLLHLRMDIPDDAKQRLCVLQKGYEGEVKFDEFCLEAGLAEKFLILRDLFLDHGGNKFQIDTLIITQKCLIICEVKYYQANYYFEDGEFRNSTSKQKIKNPLHQLSRCITLLTQLLQKYGLLLKIDGYVIFNHPEFFLYNASQNQPIVYLPQLKKFLDKLSALPADLNDAHRRIAQVLLERHIAPPINLSFSYSYEGLRKGPFCWRCSSTLVSSSGRKMVCNGCGYEEEFETAVLRGVGELRLLFPEMKIATNLVFEWCGVEGHRSRIQRVLMKNFRKIGYGKHVYYE